MTSELYPLFMKLDGRRVLVVGAGRVAARKITSLLACGAEVLVTAPEALDKVRALAEAGRIKWQQRSFEIADIEGCRLVMVASNDRSLNESVAEAAAAAGIPVNVADVPDLCDFYVPAVVNRQPLKIAVSTDGASPALARRIREELEENYPSAFGNYVNLLGEIREEVKGRAPHRLQEVSEALAAPEVRRRLETENLESIKQILRDLVEDLLKPKDKA